MRSRGAYADPTALKAITDLPRVGSVQETADYFNVSTKTVRRWITQGLIRAERIGPRLIRIDLASVEQMGRSLQYIPARGDA